MEASILVKETIFKNQTKDKKKISEVNQGRDLSEFPLQSKNSETNGGVIFNDRKYYRDFVFVKKNNLLGDQGLIDLWDGRNYFYGKVDPLGYPIYCPFQSVKPIENSKRSTPFAANFVASAFKDMCDFVAKSASNPKHGLIKNISSVYLPLSAQSGWTSAMDYYSASLKAIYSAYTVAYIPQQTTGRKKILNFDDFMNHFLIFYQDIAKIHTTILFSSFIKSSLCPRTASGLVIDTQLDQADNDLIKYETYISDPNFQAFRRIAQYHGFMINKNVPWSLVANVRHKYMIKKQLQSGILSSPTDLTDLFSNTLTKAHRQDINLLRFHMAGFYEAFISESPFETVFLDKPCLEEGFKVHVRREDRKGTGAFAPDGSFMEDSAFTKQYGNEYWLKVYYALKHIETSGNIDMKTLDKRFKNYYFMYKNRGIKSTIDKIYKDLDPQAE